MPGKVGSRLGVLVVLALALCGCEYLEEYAEEHGYEFDGVDVEILNVNIHPHHVHPGQVVHLRMRYKLETSYPSQHVHVAERRQGFFQTHPVFNRETGANRTRGTYTTTVQWHLPNIAPIGLRRVRFSVSAGGESDSRISHFQVY